jgi:hypothetical protein
MANLKTLIDQQIANAFNNILAPGGLTVEITVRFLVSNGEWDPVTEETNPIYNDVPKVTCVLAKPGSTDVKDHGVSLTDGKLIIPGTFIPQEPDTDTDRVILNGREWNIRKGVGVPGQGVYILYVNL